MNATKYNWHFIIVMKSEVNKHSKPITLVFILSMLLLYTLKWKLKVNFKYVL